jgi:hypothetical protein
MGTRDEACAALKRHIGPEPVEENRNSIAKSKEEKDMHDPPDEPGGRAPKAEAPEIGDG